MNRHRWFLTVMAMVVGVALAGPAMGTNHETMPAPHLKPKVMPVPIKPKLTEKLQPSAAKALLGVVSIRLHNDKGPGDPSFFNEASISNEFKLALTQGGYYTAIVTYKNVSTATGVKTGTLVVKNALSGWTIIKIEQSTPSIAPNKEGSVGFLLGPIGGTVSNPVQINITAGVK